MKKILVTFVLLALPAFAAEPVVCTLTTATGAAANTVTCTTGSALWAKGGSVLMQCTSDVYVSSTTPAGSQVPTPATSSMEVVGFSATTDKVAIWLNPGDHDISVLAVTTAGTCKFMTTNRRRP